LIGLVLVINSANTSITVKTKIKTENEDGYGLPIYAESSETFDALVGWGATGLDYGVDRNVMTTQATIYLPLTKRIEKGAKIYIDGSLYRQDGEGVTWEAPQGWALSAGQVVLIKKVEG
jgi:hypothetical protein